MGCIASLLLISLSSSAWGINFAGFLYGLVYWLLLNVFYTKASEISVERTKNNIYAVIGLMSYICVGLEPIFMRPFLTHDLKYTFGFSAVYTLLAIFIQFLFIIRRKIKS